MDRNSLKEYLSMLIDMEKNILLQNNTIKQLQVQVDELSKVNSYFKPTPLLPKQKSEGMFFLIAMIGIGALLAYWGINLLGSNTTKLGGIIGSFLGGILVLMFAAVFLLSGTVLLIDFIQKDAAANRNYEQSQKAYMIALENYEKNMEWEKQRAKENAPRIAAYQQELLLLQEVNEKSKTSLASMYDVNIVYSKYRNLPMLCSIYEYLASGRVDTLEGTNGAYNLLELEMRLDRIITKLDVVIEQLYRICDNQNMLYTVIVEANSETKNLVSMTGQLIDNVYSLQECVDGNTRDLVSALNEQKKTSAITAYSTERAAKELSYMNRMNYLAGRNDGTIFNLPPV